MISIASFLLAAASLASAASLQQVTNFGSNPTSINMYIYVPDKVAAEPPVIVALHPCGVTGAQWYSGTKLPSYADSQGFILVYPETPHNSNCWDVNNVASLTHNGGGDAQGIVSMVNYTLRTHGGDASRVFAMGSSSGAMMTNVLAATYPDVFAAASAYSGVAHACFFGSASSTPSGANQTCAHGLTHTAAEWAAFVRNSFPGYAGAYPRMQIWHGLADTLVYPQAGYEAVKQWSAVHKVDLAKNNTGVPSSAYTQMLYGDGSEVVGYFGQGVGHTAPVNEQVMLKFFGLLS